MSRLVTHLSSLSFAANTPDVPAATPVPVGRFPPLGNNCGSLFCSASAVASRPFLRVDRMGSNNTADEIARVDLADTSARTPCTCAAF